MTSSIKVRARRCKGTLATASLVDEDGGRGRTWRGWRRSRRRSRAQGWLQHVPRWRRRCGVEVRAVARVVRDDGVAGAPPAGEEAEEGAGVGVAVLRGGGRSREEGAWMRSRRGKQSTRRGRAVDAEEQQRGARGGSRCGRMERSRGGRGGVAA
jgi:hypothetical protein